MKPFIDFLGNEVKVGDFIIYSTGAGRSSSTQSFGVVEKVEYKQLSFQRTANEPIQYRDEFKIRVMVVEDNQIWDNKLGKYVDRGWHCSRKYSVRTLENVVKFPANLIGNNEIKKVVAGLQIEANIKLE